MPTLLQALRLPDSAGLIVEGFMASYWAAALGLSTAPTTSWLWFARSEGQRSAAAPRVPSALDIQVVLALYTALIEQVGCVNCGAPLHRVVKVDLAHSSVNPTVVIVVTRCRGWRRHRHKACVVDEAGDLRFGQFRPDFR